MKKRILFVAPRFHTNQFFLTKNLKLDGNEVEMHVLYSSISENHEYISPIIISTYNQNDKRDNTNKSLKNKRTKSIPTVPFLWHNVISKKFDIVIIRNLSGIHSYIYFVINLLLFRKIWLYTQNRIHNTIPFKRKVWYNFLHFLGVKHYSPVQGNTLLPKISKYSYYIPFVIDEMKIEQKKYINNSLKILAIGKFIERKNLIPLVKELSKIEFPFFLQIIGECSNDNHKNYLNELKSTIIEYRLQNNIEIAVNIPYNENIKMYKNFDVFILPSSNEPAAFSIVESLASYTPVICMKTCGTSCYINNGINGHLINEILEISPLINKNREYFNALSDKIIEFNTNEIFNISHFNKIVLT